MLPGVLQEFFQLLMRDMFDADYGMFKLDEETRMYWFRASNIDMSMEFELVGTMIGLAIYNSHLLEFSFPMLTYRSVLGCFQDLREINCSFANVVRLVMLGVFLAHVYIQVSLVPLASDCCSGSVHSSFLMTG